MGSVIVSLVTETAEEVGKLLSNPSCPLQALNGESQQKADNLQLEALRRYRMYLAGEQAAQLPEDCLDILADGLAQELLPHGHRPLGVLLALGLEFQTDLS